MQQRVVDWLDRAFAGDWRPIRFQPILYPLLWLAVILVAITDNEPLRMSEIIGPGAYTAWLTVGFTAPPLCLAAWVLIRYTSGRWRLRGMWLRLAADLGQLGALAGYLAIRLSVSGATDSRLYGHIIAVAACVFVAALVARDAWVLYLNERLATALHEAAQR